MRGAHSTTMLRKQAYPCVVRHEAWAEGMSGRSVAPVSRGHAGDGTASPKTALAVHLGRTITGASVAQSDVRSGSMAATHSGAHRLRGETN
jgi:hypothetical protein